VRRAIEFAHLNNLPAAVRSGGHSHAGHSTCDEGIVIDLGTMNTIEVDASRRLLRTGPGVHGHTINETAAAHGLAITLGTCPNVAIGGLAIAGGEGGLMGKMGLTCDNLLAASVVLADGRAVVASETDDRDLFWAIRGGHGNFGVVTSMLFRLHPVQRVLHGAVAYPIDKASEVLRFYRDFVPSIPDELTTAVGTVVIKGQPMFTITACYCGDLDEGRRVLAPLRSFAPPASDNIRDVSYLESQLEASAPTVGRASIQKSGFVETISDALIDAIARHLKHAPPDSIAMMNHLHGAVTRVGSEASAFSLRRDGFDFWISAEWTEAGDERRRMEWALDFWNEIEPLTSGAYVGGIPEEPPERVRFAYGANYSRLVEMKRKYDPENFFRLNQNIAPT
jgi:FAD/FMN-containing dehydrogenase